MGKIKNIIRKIILGISFVLLKIPGLNKLLVKGISAGYWKHKKIFIYSDEQPERAPKMVKFIENEFIPLLKAEDNVCEFACASGEYTMLISKYVKHIDAYDISSKMISNAKKIANEKGITNIDFYAKKVQDIKADKVYDNFVCLGLFTYIEKLKVARKIVGIISKLLLSGGYLIIKDSITKSKTRLSLNFKYAAIYRQEEKYLDLFRDDFEIIKTEYLHDFDENDFASIICLLKKK